MGERLEWLRASLADELALGRALWAAFAEGAVEVAGDLGAWPPMMQAARVASAEVAVRFLDAAIEALPAIEAEVWLPLFDPLLETPGLLDAFANAGRSRAALSYGLARAGVLTSVYVDSSVLAHRVEAHVVGRFDRDAFSDDARVWPDGAWERAVVARALEERRVSQGLVAACWSIATPRERVVLALAGDPSRLLANLDATAHAYLVDEVEAHRERGAADAARGLVMFVASRSLAPTRPPPQLTKISSCPRSSRGATRSRRTRRRSCSMRSPP